VQLRMGPVSHMKVHNKATVVTTVIQREVKERSYLRIWRKNVASLLLQKREGFQDAESPSFSCLF
jgi:hypothetical protein